MEFSFFNEPTEVVDFLKQKNKELHFDYDEIMHYAHTRTFTVAKITKIDLLGDIKTSLEEAYKNGVGFDEWKKTIIPTLKKKGWFGKTKVVNPKTKEEKEIFVGSKRLKTIFNTNMRTAYAKARYSSQMESLGEYFRYTAIMDRLTRPAHAKLHGVVLPKTDKFWEINYPPNGWGCRCKVQVLTGAECERRGITPLADSSMLRNIASKDFAYNPGKVDKLDTILKEKAKTRFGCDEFKNAKGVKFNPPCDKIKSDTLEISKKLALFKAIKQMYQTDIQTAKNSKNKVLIAKASEDIKESFGDKEILNIYLSEWTIASHKHHQNITAFDYYLLHDILKRKATSIKKSKKDNLIFGYYYLGLFYRVVLKKTSKKEIFIQSIIKGTTKIEKEIKENKKVAFARRLKSF